MQKEGVEEGRGKSLMKKKKKESRWGRTPAMIGGRRGESGKTSQPKKGQSKKKWEWHIIKKRKKKKKKKDSK